ncbi:MAG: hypothetical protein ACRC68_18955 [Clostridium sp.]
MIFINKQGKNEASKRAKEMMIAGNSWAEIMEETRLRQKDLQKIQLTEIDPKF